MAESMMSAGEEGQAPAPEGETQEQAPAPEGDQGGAEELLAGKYKTPEDLVAAYKSLESKIGLKEEDLRKQIEEDFNKERYGKRPESPGDYQLPEGIDEEAAGTDQLLDWWSKHSHEQGFDQEQFEQGIEMFRQHVQGQAPDLEAEEKKLGDNAKARLEAASLFVQKHVPKESMDAVEQLFMSAEGVMAVEALMEAAKSGTIGDDKPAQTGGVDAARLREMQADERYWNPSKRDPNFVKEVEEGYRKLYGG